MRLPAATLLLAEIVFERLAGYEGPPTECVHVLDAAMICGDDVRRLPYAERRRRIELLVEAIATDPLVEAQRPIDRSDFEPVDPYATAKRPRTNESKAKGSEEQQQQQRPRSRFAPPDGHDGVRVRLKPEYRLHQISEALGTAREREERKGASAVGAVVGTGRAEGGGANAGGGGAAASASSAAAGVWWPCRGLLLLPGHASPLLPLEPAGEWKREFSKSQQKEYYFNARTGRLIWAEHRKARPISFRSSASAMLRWERRSTTLPEAELLRLAQEIPEPPPPRVW
jgi:hypothetical protein